MTVEEGRAFGEPSAGVLGEQVLEEKGDPREGPVPRRYRGGPARLVEQGRDHRVQPGVEALDAADRRVHQLERRGLAPPDERGLAQPVEVREGIHGEGDFMESGGGCQAHWARDEVT